MEKGMCKEFLKILLDIQNEYTENDKESVTTSEVIFAAFKFFSLEKEELELFLKTDKSMTRYELLKMTMRNIWKEHSGCNINDFSKYRDAFAYDFKNINDIISSISDFKFPIEKIKLLGCNETIPEYIELSQLIEETCENIFEEENSKKKINNIINYYGKQCKKLKKINVEKSNISHVMIEREELKKQLKKKIMGQDMVIDKFLDGYISYRFRGKTSGKPAALYLFAGPPGTGKTYLAETFVKLVESEGYVYKRFDMAAYGGSSDNVTGLVGFEKTWRNAEPGMLTNFVKENPKCILLFDEIEKADLQVRMLFLSVLEGAVLTDKYYDEQVSFEEAIIIFTTNEGKDLYENNRETNLTALADSAVIDGLKESKFAPELISRFMTGTVIMFNHLSYASMLDMFKHNIEKNIKPFHQNIQFEFKYDDNLAKLYLMNKGINIDARFVSSNTKRIVEKYFLRAMSHESMQSDKGLNELKEIVISVDINEDVREYFERKKESRILGYTTSFEKLECSEDCKWVNYEEFKECLKNCNWNNTNDRYDAILIDLFSDADEKNVSYINTKGYECLKEVIEEKLNIPIIVVEKESENISLQLEEKESLKALGVTDFVKEVSNTLDKDKLNEILDMQHFVDVATQLVRKEQKLSADDTFEYESGTLTLCFTNLRVENAVEDDAELRRQNKEILLEDKPKVRVKEIFGNELAKEAVKRCIDNIKYPEKYKKVGARLMKGILMYGAPGMGKTMFAKAMAYESGASFISVAGSDFIKDDGITKLNQIFQTARRKKPCIVFIDEFDAISEKRGRNTNTYIKAVLEMFLKEMDGLESDNDGVYVIGATNFTPNELDSAVMRRFSAKIPFTYPNIEERHKFLLFILEQKGLDKVLSKRESMTLNFMMYETMRSYAEIENFIEESISESIYKGKSITSKFLFNRVQNEKSGSIQFENGEDMILTAFHEAGHAVLQYIFGLKQEYVTIISRGNYSGYAMSECDYYTAKGLLNHICICFAGRIAEMKFLNNSRSKNCGASNDLQKATNLAYQYVCRYGFDNRLLVVPEYFSKNEMPECILPEKEKEDIWNSVNNILEQQWKRTVELVNKYQREIICIANSLGYMKELEGEKVENIIQNKVPYIKEDCFLDWNLDYYKNLLFGYPIFPHAKIKIDLHETDIMTEPMDKHYYYTVKNSARNIKYPLYDDLTVAFEVAFQNNANCRRFESEEAALEYLNMLELKAVCTNNQNISIESTDGAMDELIDNEEFVSWCLREDDITELQKGAEKDNSSLAQYLIKEIKSCILKNNIPLIIQIYDPLISQEILQYMALHNLEEGYQKDFVFPIEEK